MNGVIITTRNVNDKAISSVIDYCGNILLEISCDGILSNSCDYLDMFSFKIDGKYGCVAMDCGIVLDAIYDAVYPHPSGKVIVKQDELYYLYDPQSSTMKETNWDYVNSSSVFSVEMNGLTYVLSNTTGDLIKNLVSYDKIRIPNSGDMIIVTGENYRQRYCSLNGTPLFAGEWTEASAFVNGYAFVGARGCYRVIDLNGRYTTGTCILEISSELYDEGEGLRYAKLMDGRYVIIDEIGNPIASSTEEEVYPYF